MHRPTTRLAGPCWFIVLCLCISSGTGAADPPSLRLADVPIDYRSLETQASATYDIALNVGTVGVRGELSFTASTTMTTTVARDHVMMEDEWEIMGRDIALRMKCDRAPLLRLRESTLTISRKDESVTASLAVSDEQCVIDVNGEKSEIPYPGGTLMQAAAFRLVPLLPRGRGVTYTFDHYTESVEIKVQEPDDGKTFSIECHGPEAVSLGSQNIGCTKYVLNVPRPIEFFVDGQSRIRMVVADGGETVMVRRENGLAGAGR